jgi:predicted pyridoxine 5'-phosphate oxidase superfamily flavin-nucleotide-binding protein
MAGGTGNASIARPAFRTEVRAQNVNDTDTQRSISPGDELLRSKFATPDVPTSATISDSIAHDLESLDFFFIATSNKEGECDSSYRGKRKGVPAVKVLDEKTIIFPDYAGNGSFRSLGNILENPHIGMLFMDFGSGVRMRINGEAEISDDPAWRKLFPGSLQTVKVTVREVYKQNRPVRISPK